jgi:hypothetical protein
MPFAWHASFHEWCLTDFTGRSRTARTQENPPLAVEEDEPFVSSKVEYDEGSMNDAGGDLSETGLSPKEDDTGYGTRWHGFAIQVLGGLFVTAINRASRCLTCRMSGNISFGSLPFLLTIP